MRTTLSSLLLLIAPLSVAVGTDARADNLVIWTPVKVSDRSYKATMGFRLPMAWETSAGADIGLASTRSGALVPDSEQAALWGRISKVGVTPAARVEQAASVRVDTLRATASLMLSRSRSWIFSDSLDMQTTRSVNVSYDPVDTRQTSVTTSQALKLIQPWTGTSVSAGANFNNVSSAFTSSLVVSQNIVPNLDLTATVNDPGSADRSGNIRLNYNITW
ncbi:hypothetical protein QTL95_15180 [Rhizobium sp. S152]|uniref:hypothetical protein n=1 Tax=Rhizobium sp. S152 TaxID=3055038 RepID=UPI0025A9A763|nr:hypothetical protein [Rhizobium sp. S152]MDM9627249.1 hypothetical protein [Rhizobium sp. S152]